MTNIETYGDKLNPNKPDYDPILEDIRATIFKEYGQNMILQVSANVFGDKITELDGELVIYIDDKDEECKKTKVNEFNLKFINDLLDIDIEDELLKDAYK